MLDQGLFVCDLVIKENRYFQNLVNYMLSTSSGL